MSIDTASVHTTCGVKLTTQCATSTKKGKKKKSLKRAKTHLGQAHAKGGAVSALYHKRKK